MMTLGMRLPRTSLLSVRPKSSVSSSSTILMTFCAGVSESSTSAVKAALLRARDEALHHLEVHVGFQKRHADLAHGVVDVVLGQAALAAQPAEYALKAFGEVLEHGSALPSSVMLFARGRLYLNPAAQGELHLFNEQNECPL